MNRIFSPFGEGWPGFPRRSYGRLDQTEPVVLDGAPEAVFCFDVVDAEWPGFESGHVFDLTNPSMLEERLRDFWARLFKHEPGVGPDPYDDLPIFRVEITSKPGSPWFEQLVALPEDEWVELTLSDTGGVEVDVFGGLLAAAVTARLQNVLRNIPQSAALNTLFSMNTWPDASEADLRTAIGSLPFVKYLIALDVGQGSAIGLADAQEDIHLYFDLGGGVYRNAPTRPNPLRFCWRQNAPIVLSHWDSDHWAGETTDPLAASKTWIAPRQKITKTHVAFGNRILNAGGSLLIWGKKPATLSMSLAGGQTLELSKCTGTSRNGSGIAAIVSDVTSQRQWLLTGDAGYHELASIPPVPAAVVIPHHGADMGVKSTPPPSPGGYARLLYSFGPGNKHGRTSVQHPTTRAMTAHQTQGWDHGTWVGAVPGGSLAGKDVLATAVHASSHLNGMVVSWSAAPAVPLTTFPCATPGASVGCTGSVPQA